MARIARIVAVGYPHHVTQRGNNKQVIFKDDADRKKYLDLIRIHSAKYRLDILGYCLMANHVHFVAIPQTLDALAKTFNFAHMRYSQYFNKKMGMSGHLWQGRFYSCVMDERHLYACVRYIERNPVRANIVKEPVNYQWSSARIHCGIEEKDNLGVNRIFDYIEYTRGKWNNFIRTIDEREDIAEIKRHTLKGFPMGEEGLIRKLENKLGRFLRINPRGRPKNKK